MWRFGLLVLLAVAAPGAVFAEQLRRTSKLFQRAMNEAPDDDLLRFVTQLHARTALVRLMVMSYLLIIVPVFFFLSVDDGVIVFPVWLGLIAILLNAVWASFVAHACWRDNGAWKELYRKRKSS